MAREEPKDLISSLVGGIAAIVLVIVGSAIYAYLMIALSDDQNIQIGFTIVYIVSLIVLPKAFKGAATALKGPVAGVTTRVVLLIMMGTLPLMVVPSHRIAVLVFLGYNVAVLLLLLMDLKISPKPEEIDVGRELPLKLSLGEENEVIIRVLNRSRKAVLVTVRDEFPLDFRSDRSELVAPVAAKSEAVLRYNVTPFRRGDFYFGGITLRYRGIMELTVRERFLSLPAKVEVYPNIKSISRFEISIRRRRLSEVGLKPERKRGSGTEFESLREYIAGDEIRKLDWKASARKNKLITKEFQAEVNQSILVALDCSRSMGARVGGLTLLDFAVNAALLLGYQVTRKDDKIGVITFSDKIHSFIPPKRGKANFACFLKELFNVQSRRVEPDFGLLFKFIMANRIKRSLLIIISDLVAGGAVENLGSSIFLVSRKHLPVVVSIVDPVVPQTAFGIPRFQEDPFRKVVAQEILERIKRAQKEIGLKGVVSLSLQPQEVTSSLLASYLNLKLRARI